MPTSFHGHQEHATHKKDPLKNGWQWGSECSILQWKPHWPFYLIGLHCHRIYELFLLSNTTCFKWTEVTTTHWWSQHVAFVSYLPSCIFPFAIRVAKTEEDWRVSCFSHLLVTLWLKTSLVALGNLVTLHFNLFVFIYLQPINCEKQQINLGKQ